MVVKDVKVATDYQNFAKRFTFAPKINVLTYKTGLLKKFQKVDGKFDQMYYVFNGSGEL